MLPILIASLVAMAVAAPPRTPWRNFWTVTKFLFAPKPAAECRACEKLLPSEMDQFPIYEGIVCLQCLEKIEAEVARIIPKWFDERLSEERQAQLLAEMAVETNVPGAGGVRELVAELEEIPPKENPQRVIWLCHNCGVLVEVSYGDELICGPCKACRCGIHLLQGESSTCMSCLVSPDPSRNIVCKNMEPW